MRLQGYLSVMLPGAMLVFCVPANESGASGMAMPNGYGLGFCALERDKALHLELRHNYDVDTHGYVRAYDTISLGEARPAGQGPYEVSVENAGSGFRSFRVAGKQEGLTVTVSRLSPAALIEIEGTEAVLFAGPKSSRANPEGLKRTGITLQQPRVPRNFAFSDSESVQTGVLSGEGLDLDGVEQGWLLLWHGADAWFCSGKSTLEYEVKPGYGRVKLFPGDAPVLMVFSQPPFVSLTGLPDSPDGAPGGGGPDGGITCDFHEPGARIALMPLYGYLMPDAAETAAWAETGELPADVKERCDWWAERLAEVPVDIEESWTYDAASGTATAEWEYVYERVRPGGTRIAPLPPMLELARREGFPITLSGEPVDSGMALYCGPYAALDNAGACAARIGGLGKYALEMPRIVPPGADNEGAAALRAELESEIDKMLAAGLLAPVNLPYKMSAGWSNYVGSRVRLLYSAPGHTLSTLAGALPFLDSERRRMVREYMIELRESYPPELIAHLPPDQGARREAWDIVSLEYAAGFSDSRDRGNFHFLNSVVKVQAMYDLAEYYRTIGGDRIRDNGFDLDVAIARAIQPWQDRGDWATLGWYSWQTKDASSWGSYGWNMSLDINRQIAGLIGLSRLARMTGDSGKEHLALAQLARALTHRFAVAGYVGWLYERGGFLLQPEGFSPDTDPRDASISEKQAAVGYGYGYKSEHLWPRFTDGEGPYMDMTPELARFFADFLKADAENFAMQTESFYPDAFMTLAYPHRVDEWFHNYPWDSWQIFMVHARILGADGDALRRLRDVPLVPVGDLYYIDKLMATLQAYGQTAWVPFAAE